MQQTRLTPAAAKELTAGGVLRDHEVKGLYLRAGATGKSWTLRYHTRSGIDREPKIGSFPEMSLDAARRIAKELKERVARGEDPMADWSEQRGIPTVARLCERYLKEYAPTRCSENGLRQHRQVIGAFIIPALGSKRVSEIKRPDVDKFLQRIYNREFDCQKKSFHKGKVAHWSARHARACLSHLFNVGFEYFEIKELERNPVRGTVTFERIHRKRRALPGELAKIFGLLAEHSKEPTKRELATYVWTLFLTGARVNEFRASEWADLVHKPRGAVAISLEKHKTAKHIGEKEIPLPRQVWALIQSLPRSVKLIFPTITDTTLRNYWNDVRETVGCTSLQMLDARRTFASYALSHGKTLSEVGEMLFHTSTQTTKGYAYLLEEQHINSVNDVADAMDKAAQASIASDQKLIDARTIAVSIGK